MKSSDVRNAFVNYFKKQGHTHVGSSSLIPENDPTLLFANAGMNQFKNTFLGIETRDYKRAVTVQKCVRAGGKHNDLENVGFTARHHTFFEMLGNFSFGDYFKKEAIHYAWELLTKDLQIPKEKLYVTVFQTDDEAAEIWHKQEGIPKDRIFRFGEKDNFWRMGDTGPCGPCSEIFYDHGPKAGKESDPFKGIAAGEDRFIEIWNLVFMQFYEKSPGQMDPLPKPSVDTGSGLERAVAAMQGQYNNYDTDLFRPMLDAACGKLKINFLDLLHMANEIRQNPSAKEIQGKKVGEILETLSALRVMGDHSRTTAFLLADGALPSNEGRGYVLRRILRRAIRYGRKLSEDQSLLPVMVEKVISSMSDFYPELQQRRDFILGHVRDEETRFLQTLDQGTEILENELNKLHSQKAKILPGELVFKLYDTYGFPVDLTHLMAKEKGFEVDEAAFETEMEKARTKAKASWKGKAIQADEAHLIQISQQIFQSHKATIFTGYQNLEDSGNLLLLSDGKKIVNTLKAGETGLMILNQTPFYAEGGGQIGDQGIFQVGSNVAKIFNTTKHNEIFVHHVEIEKGEFKTGEKIQAQVQSESRLQTMANHSATHLMHAALKQILGKHITQAGSIVDPLRLRFDFTHNQPMSPAEIEKVENLVNEQIEKSIDVQTNNMKHKDAIASGAVALFGEKYGDEVRVLRMGDFSTELCGGTHVKNTAQIRLFKIVSESGVSAGVRRIEAITGTVASKYAFKMIQENLQSRHAAGLSNSWQQFVGEDDTLVKLPQWIEDKKAEIKGLEREIKKAKGAQVNLDQLISQATSFSTKSGTVGKLVLADLDIEDREVLSQISDHLKNKIQSGVVVVVGKGDQTHPLIVSVSKDLISSYKAGDILRELAAAMGGKGGGRPDFAQGAAPQRDQLSLGFSKIKGLFNN